MSPSSQSTARTFLYFFAIVAAVAAAFLYGYWQVKPRSDDQFTRLMNVGKNYYEQGNSARAVETMESAAALQPTHPDVHINLANAYLQAGRAEDALAQAREVLNLEPNSAAAHYIAGCALLRLSRFEDAVKELQASKDLDPKVNAVSFHLGRAYQGWGKFEEAAEQFREVIQFEEQSAPIYLTAQYNLGQVLVRLGQTDQANEVLAEYQKLLAERPNRSTDLTLLERSVYTSLRVPFQLEQPAATGVKVQFADATTNFFGNMAAKYRAPIGVLDINHRGSNDVVVAEAQTGFRLLLNNNAAFEAAGEALPSIPDARYTRCLIGDLNNDRFEDAIFVGDKGVQAFRFATNGVATDATALSNLRDAPAIDGALVDLDFTGKLDLLLIPPGTNSVRVLRNLGNMYFKDTTSTSGVPATLTSARRLSVDDWNNDDIMDLFVIRQAQPPLVLVKERGGALTETNSPASWPAATALVVGDLNNDLRNDTVIAVSGQLEVAFSGLTNRLRIPAGEFRVDGLSLVDYDNDGWLDICAWGSGLRVWRNAGQAGFRESTGDLGLVRVVQGTLDQLAAADFDNDGDTDLLLSRGERGLQMLRNQGSNANQQLKLRLVGNRSNFTGLGVRIEVTSGNWRTIRTVTQLPIEIGVGKRQQLDALDVHWADTAAASAEVPVDPRTTLVMLELMMPTGSCPYLYAWDGKGFRFVTDLLGASPLGLPIAPGRLIQADSDEFVWIGDERMFPARGDKLTLQVTEELREVLYLDEAKLVVADHVSGTEVHPTDKLLPAGPFPPSALVTLANRRPLVRALNLNGTDVTDLVGENDGRLVSPMKLRPPQLRGLAEMHGVIMDFGPLPVERPLVLALTGWLRFGGGMANIAASHDPDLPFPFPILEVETVTGQWQTVSVQAGAPAGKTKTILVDLAGKLPSSSQRLKLSTAFEIHWDRFALFERVLAPETKLAVLSASSADLHWRGFSRFEDRPWTQPLTPAYGNVQARPNWLITPAGWCTRYGSVDELIAKRDDALVLLNGGDELTLEFPAGELPPKPQGYTRDYFFYSVGWDKDADFHVRAGTTVEPLPFNGMDDQRYGELQRSSTDWQWWIAKYNTRWVGPRTFDRKPARISTAQAR